jgi:hypothetical protein
VYHMSSEWAVVPVPRCESRQTKLVVSISQRMHFTPRDDFKRAVVLSLISSLYCVGNTFRTLHSENACHLCRSSSLPGFQ